MPIEQTSVEVDPQLQRVLSPMREEYRAELEASGVRAALRVEVLEAFDELKRRQGNGCGG